MKEQIINYIKAGYPGLFIQSTEDNRVRKEIRDIAAKIKYRLYSWSFTSGLLDVETGKNIATEDPMELFDGIKDMNSKCIILMQDFHMLIEDPNPVLYDKIKKVLHHNKTTAKVLIGYGCRQTLPPELEKEFAFIEFDLPNRESLEEILRNCCTAAKYKLPIPKERAEVIDAATGLTSVEAENAFALSLVTKEKKLDPVKIANEKAQIVKKSGLLEIVQTNEDLSTIGGLDYLKDWLINRKNAFTTEARTYGLPLPKGILIVGIPGTGKSLTAKAVAGLLKRPLLKLDIGKLFGGLVGQSEGNLRSAIKTIEAVSPCILMIDEIEKSFSGTKSSGTTDGGTSARVFGTWLNWMQEKTSPVFIVATANDVSALPPEMLRAGRFDQMFFTDLPTKKEREAIWKIQIAKHKRKPETYNVKTLANNTNTYTGAEIEQIFIDSLYSGFAKKTEPTMNMINKSIKDTVPLSITMKREITALKEWAKDKARPASYEEHIDSSIETTEEHRQISTECNNPF